LNKQLSQAGVHKSQGSGCHGVQAPNIYRPLVYNLFHFILLAPIDLTWRPDFWTICVRTEENRHNKHHPAYVNLTPSCRQRFNSKIK